MKVVEEEFEGILILEKERGGEGGAGGVFWNWTAYGVLTFGCRIVLITHIPSSDRLEFTLLLNEAQAFKNLCKIVSFIMPRCKFVVMLTKPSMRNWCCSSHGLLALDQPLSYFSKALSSHN